VIVVDTTVLVYAVGVEHALRVPCRALVEAVGDGRVRATTTVEVVQEFAHVRARRRERADAAGLARSYASLFGPLVSVDARHLALGLDLFERYSGLGPFDAVLAAVALESGAEAFVSADAAFAAVDGLAHLDPAAPDFLDRIAAPR
jgi:predicted nucleic acid-binding protein